MKRLAIGLYEERRRIGDSDWLITYERDDQMAAGWFWSGFRIVDPRHFVGAKDLFGTLDEATDNVDLAIEAGWFKPLRQAAKA